MIAIENIDISVNSTTGLPGSFSLAASTLTTTENVGTYNIVVNRTGGSTGSATVDYAINPGSASTPADFSVAAGLTGTLTFADGETSKNIAVTIVNDTDVEPTENFTVTLSNATTASLGSPSTASVNITDNDVAGTFAFTASTASVNEADGTVTLTISRSNGSAGAVAVSYSTADGSATDGSDYTGTASGVVNFAAGDLTKTITIPITNDTDVEDPETFTVTLNSATNTGVIGSPATATVTIISDDVPGDPGVIDFAVTSINVNEAAGTATLTVTRSATGAAATVDYATADSSASSPGDYTAKTGTLSFGVGVDTATIVIDITNDGAGEPVENFTVTLSNPTGGATIGANNTATVNIIDDDIVVPTGILLNEVYIDPPGGANPPKQFIELRGPAGASLDNILVMQLEGDFNQNAGTVDFVIDLSGKTLGSNGLLLIAAATNGWTPSDPATTLVTTSALDATTTGLEAASYSFILAYRNPADPTTPAIGDDFDSDDAIDANGKGTLDALPLNLTVLDGFGTTDSSDANDVRYVTVLPALAAGGSADAVVRTTTAVGDPLAFYYGINGGGSSNTSLAFTTNANQRSANFPAAGAITPGAVNAGVVTDTTPPQVVSTTFDPRQGQKIVVTFSEDVSAGLDVSDFGLSRVAGGAPNLALVVSSISQDGKTVTLTFTGTGGPSTTVLQDGTYNFVAKSSITDVAGNPLAADVPATIKFLNGDFDVNGTVSFTDLVTLAQNYNQNGRTFAQGDTNYDGAVNFTDLVNLAQRYNQSISIESLMAMMPGSSTPASTPASTPTVTPSRKVDEIGLASPTPTATGVTLTPAVKVTAKVALGTKTVIR